MKTFLARAEEILATAREAGGEDCEMAILIAPDGQVRFLPAAGWALEPLRREYGAETAYRVERRQGQVRVEARAPREHCVIWAARALDPGLADFPQYFVSQLPA